MATAAIMLSVCVCVHALVCVGVFVKTSIDSVSPRIIPHTGLVGVLARHNSRTAIKQRCEWSVMSGSCEMRLLSTVSNECFHTHMKLTAEHITSVTVVRKHQGLIDFTGVPWICDCLSHYQPSHLHVIRYKIVSVPFQWHYSTFLTL